MVGAGTELSHAGDPPAGASGAIAVEVDDSRSVDFAVDGGAHPLDPPGIDDPGKAHDTVALERLEVVQYPAARSTTLRSGSSRVYRSRLSANSASSFSV